MKKLIFALLLCSGSLMAQKIQTLATTKDVDNQVARFMAQMKQQEFAEAFAALKPFWPLQTTVVDDLANTTIEQLSQLGPLYGKLIGAELVNSEKCGTFGYLVQYVLKYENSALRYSFYYYNGGSGWMVNSVSFDDKWEKFFKAYSK